MEGLDISWLAETLQELNDKAAEVTVTGAQHVMHMEHTLTV